jgi:hypothetical protein
MLNETFVEVYWAKDEIQATLLKAALEDADTPARVLGGPLCTTTGYSCRLGAVTLLVAEQDAEKAKAILHELERPVQQNPSV